MFDWPENRKTGTSVFPNDSDAHIAAAKVLAYKRLTLKTLD
jgi:hypothetical protein